MTVKSLFISIIQFEPRFIVLYVRVHGGYMYEGV